MTARRSLLMHSTDLKSLTNLAPVAKSLMEKAGFKVDMQSMDWQTLVARRAKKDPPSAGGWNAFLTAWVAADVMNPVSTGLSQLELRQGPVRLALRRDDGEAARRFRAGIGSGQAEGDRGRGPEAQYRDHRRDPRRRIRLAAGAAQERQGPRVAPAPVFWNIELTK